MLNNHTCHIVKKNNQLFISFKVRWAKQQKILNRSKRDYITYGRDSRSSKRFATKGGLNDPKWPKMWYLVSSYFALQFIKLTLS